MASYTHKNRGVCSSQISFELDGDVVKNVSFVGGCNGNLAGIGKLVEGMKAQDVIDRVKGTKCGFKNTSCPDQLALALEEALAQQN